MFASPCPICILRLFPKRNNIVSRAYSFLYYMGEFTSGSLKSPKAHSGVGLTHLSNIWRTDRRSFILGMCPTSYIAGPWRVIKCRQQASSPH